MPLEKISAFLVTLTYSSGQVITYERETLRGLNGFIDQVVKNDLDVLDKVVIERIKNSD